MRSDYGYMKMAKDTAFNANCKNKKLGSVLVVKGFVINGFNGPPYEISDCEECPKSDKHGIESSYFCRAVHAERRCLLIAARMGLCTNNSILYSYMGVPCKDCLLELIEAGVKEIVCINHNYYDELSKDILKEWIEFGGKFRVLEV